MLKYDYFYFKPLNIRLRLEIYIPNNIKGPYDTLYLLDGENTFRDFHTTYGRSLRLEGTLSYLAKPLMAIGISALENRTSLYSPFKIKNTTTTEWLNNDTALCRQFSDALINELIPYIDNKYNTNIGSRHRFIYGSSLAAIEALYLGLFYKDSFSYIAAFSTPSFIYNGELEGFIKANITSDKHIFLYVGEKESSDGEYNSSCYLKATNSLYSLIKDKCSTRLMINKIGTHDEKSWGTYLSDYISFIYATKS